MAKLVHCADEDGNPVRRTYGYAKEDMWMDYTEFEGAVVPLEVIQQMRREENAELGSWEGRGIKVGDKGWKVLTDWKESWDK